MSDPGLPKAAGQPEAAPAPAPSADPWAEAEVAYNADPVTDGLPNLVDELPAAPGTDKPKEQPDPTPAPEATPDFKGVNLWNPEGITTPEQFAEHLKKVQAWSTKHSTETKAEIEKRDQATQELVGLIAQVAGDPAKLAMVLRAHGPDLEKMGIPVNYEALKPGDDPKDNNPGTELATQRGEFVQDVRKRLIEAKSDEEFSDAIADLVWSMHEQHLQGLQVFGGALMKKMGETVDGKIRPFSEKEARVARTQTWNGAIEELKANPEMAGFEEATKPPVDANGQPVLDAEGNPVRAPLHEYIRNDPILMPWMIAINKDARAAAERGITPALLLRKAYEQWSTPNRIKTAADKAREEALNSLKGMPEAPGTHANTTRATGMTWDEIEAEVGDPFRS